MCVSVQFKKILYLIMTQPVLYFLQGIRSCGIRPGTGPLAAGTDPVTAVHQPALPLQATQQSQVARYSCDSLGSAQ
jgi:hypothetical protein